MKVWVIMIAAALAGGLVAHAGHVMLGFAIFGAGAVVASQVRS